MKMKLLFVFIKKKVNSFLYLELKSIWLSFKEIKELLDTLQNWVKEIKKISAKGKIKL